jgi:CBS-domain-containing membrane protein
MKPTAIFNPDFLSLQDTDTVREATRRMLQNRVSDLPVVDASGKLLGMLKLERLLAVVLPRACLIGPGVPDLSFAPDTIDDLRARMREIEDKPVKEFVIDAPHVIHPDTSPLEVVLMLYRGANNIPVIARDSGKLVGMAAARDVLAALHGAETG